VSLQYSRTSESAKVRPLLTRYGFIMLGINCGVCGFLAKAAGDSAKAEGGSAKAPPMINASSASRRREETGIRRQDDGGGVNELDIGGEKMWL
jgi:hypothetical protein